MWPCAKQVSYLCLESLIKLLRIEDIIGLFVVISTAVKAKKQ